MTQITDDKEWTFATDWEADSANELISWDRDLILGLNGVDATSKIATIFEV